MTNHIDPELSIGAARQTSTTATRSLRTSTVQVWHRPRKLIGFDLIKGLHDISRRRLGNKYAYDHCAVQRDRDGNILPEFNLDAMRMIRNRHELTYSHLIHHAVDEAEQIASRLNEMDPEMRFGFLNSLIKDARKDGRIAWVLSAACLRRLIFPQSYNGKRCDNVHYTYTAKDEACGKPVQLDSLQPNHVKRFLSHAERMCPTISLETITPITAQ